MEIIKISLFRGDMEVHLGKKQLRAISGGVASAPVDKELVHIGIAHAAKLTLRHDKVPDYVTRKVVFSGDVRRTDELVGAGERLNEERMRVLVLETTRLEIQCSCGNGHLGDVAWTTPCMRDGSYTETRVPAYVHALYDRFNIVFVDAWGRTLYIPRSHLEPLPNTPQSAF